MQIVLNPKSKVELASYGHFTCSECGVNCCELKISLGTQAEADETKQLLDLLGGGWMKEVFVEVVLVHNHHGHPNQEGLTFPLLYLKNHLNDDKVTKHWYDRLEALGKKISLDGRTDEYKNASWLIRIMQEGLQERLGRNVFI